VPLPGGKEKKGGGKGKCPYLLFAQEATEGGGGGREKGEGGSRLGASIQGGGGGGRGGEVLHPSRSLKRRGEGRKGKEKRGETTYDIGKKRGEGTFPPASLNDRKKESLP